MHVFLYFRLHAKHHKERDCKLRRAGHLRHYQGTHIKIWPHDRYETYKPYAFIMAICMLLLSDTYAFIR